MYTPFTWPPICSFQWFYSMWSFTTAARVNGRHAVQGPLGRIRVTVIMTKTPTCTRTLALCSCWDDVGGGGGGGGGDDDDSNVFSIRSAVIFGLWNTGCDVALHHLWRLLYSFSSKSYSRWTQAEQQNVTCERSNRLSVPRGGVQDTPAESSQTGSSDTSAQQQQQQQLPWSIVHTHRTRIKADERVECDEDKRGTIQFNTRCHFDAANRGRYCNAFGQGYWWKHTYQNCVCVCERKCQALVCVIYVVGLRTYLCIYYVSVSVCLSIVSEPE